MHILLTGASGFIGRHIHQSLLAAGHRVTAASRSSAMPVDFVRDTHAQDWLPRLHGIDAVVNAVGVLRNSRRQPMQAIHADAPCALFDACAQAGVRRVVQISALGIADGDTPYASTKKVADAHVLRLTQAGALDGTVVRPSIVFGPGAQGTELFVTLSRLPLLVLPRQAIEAQVQPLAACDLGDAVAALLGEEAARQHGGRIVHLAGARPLPLAAFIASPRVQAGKNAPHVLALPDWMGLLSARMGDAVPLSPWCSQTLALLCTDNVADGAALRALIGRAPVPPDALLATLRNAAQKPLHGASNCPPDGHHSSKMA